MGVSRDIFIMNTVETIEVTETVIQETVQQPEKQVKTKKSFLDTSIFIILAVTALLLPFFVIPGFDAGLESQKNLFLAIAVGSATFLWLWRQLKALSFSLPKSPVLISGAVLVFVTVLSSLFSPAIEVSLYGFVYDMGTVTSMLILFLLLFLTSVTFYSEERIVYFYVALFLSFGVLALYQIVRLFFGADALSLGLFFDSTDSLIGKWNDFGVFAGLITLLSVIALEFAPWNKMQRYLIYVFLWVSLFFLIVVNFYLAWFLLGIFSLVLVVYNLTFGRNQQQNKNISIPSLTVLILSVVFIVGGSFLGGIISKYTHISQLEVRPSWGATLGLVADTWKEDALLGTGPNRFTSQWLQYKGVSINETRFWNTDFNSGIGFIPSFAITTGVLGILAWIFFLGAILYRGTKVLFASNQNNRVHYFAFSSFIASLYLWVVTIFYVPNITIVSLAFFLTGIFLAFAIQRGGLSTITLASSRDPRIGFVSTFIMIILMIGTVYWGYVSGKKVISLVYFDTAVDIINDSGNVTLAEQYLMTAAKLNVSDSYYRTIVELERAKLQALLSQTSADTSQEEARARFQEILGLAINAAQSAVDVDQTNYQNWLSLSRVYRDVVQFESVVGAYENASASLDRARQLNPSSPLLVLEAARLETSRGDTEKARENIFESLSLKSNYTDAIYLYAQIELSEGNTETAIASLETVAVINPNDSGLFFNIGFLKYNEEDYSGATLAFERAVITNPIYANAKYFLGLSYYYIDRNEDAIAQFEDVRILNPDNEQVLIILNNLKDNRSPFATPAQAAEILEEPPIEE